MLLLRRRLLWVAVVVLDALLLHAELALLAVKVSLAGGLFFLRRDVRAELIGAALVVDAHDAGSAAVRVLLTLLGGL